MKNSTKMIWIVLFFIVLVGFFMSRDHSSSTAAQSAQAATGEDAPTGQDTHTDLYNAKSTEQFDPLELMKNPYQWRAHSGILDNLRTPVLMPTGGRSMPGVAPMSMPFPCLKFEKMLDEHTAMYEVSAYEDGVLMPQGELAVIVNDSVAPDPARAWRILVDGPMEGLNGFGAGIKVTQVSFAGYETPEERHRRLCSNEDVIPIGGFYTSDANGCRHLYIKPEPTPEQNQAQQAQQPQQEQEARDAAEQEARHAAEQQAQQEQ